MSVKSMKRRRWILVVPLLLAFLAVLAVGRRPTVGTIVHQRGYAITGQEPQDVTICVRKDQLPAELDFSADHVRTDYHVPVYQDGTTTLYLKSILYANGGTEWLSAAFYFEYDLPRTGSLLLPYEVDPQDDGTTTFITGSMAPERIACDLSTQYEDAVSLHGVGSGEQFSIYLRAEVFEGAREFLSFRVNGLNRLCYQS